MAAPAFDHTAIARPAFVWTAPGAPSLGTAALLRAAYAVATWEMRARTRASLRAMDPLRLSDLGLTTAEALHECAKPFWRA